MASTPRRPRLEDTIRPDRQIPYLRVQSVTIYVRELERSIDFYVGQLGFQLLYDARQQPGRRWATVAPPDGTANLTLVEPGRNTEAQALIGRPTQVTFVTEDVLAKYREWTGRGVRFPITPRLKRLKHGVQSQAYPPPDTGTTGGEAAPIWGGVYTRFRDPDGNSYALVSFDEVTHAIEEQRRAIAEKMESERRVTRELEIAKQVQARLFPQTLPRVRTLEYAGICHQAHQVGGDYYDFLDLGNSRVGFVIGDISGKGIAAALLMSNLQAHLRGQCAVASDRPEHVLCSVNRLFCESTTDGAYATLLFAEYDDLTRRLRYANCGHLPGLLVRGDDSLQRLEATATVMGIFQNWECSIEECELLPGDTLVLYTDGITESFRDDGEEFGEERLVALLRRGRHLPSLQLLSAIVDEVHQFSTHEQHDDITLIVAKCPAKPLALA